MKSRHRWYIKNAETIKRRKRSQNKKKENKNEKEGTKKKYIR